MLKAQLDFFKLFMASFVLTIKGTAMENYRQFVSSQQKKKEILKHMQEKGINASYKHAVAIEPDFLGWILSHISENYKTINLSLKQNNSKKEKR